MTSLFQMDYGTKLKIELQSGSVFIGEFAGNLKDELVLTNSVELNSGKYLSQPLYFLKKNICGIRLLPRNVAKEFEPSKYDPTIQWKFWYDMIGVHCAIQYISDITQIKYPDSKSKKTDFEKFIENMNHVDTVGFQALPIPIDASSDIKLLVFVTKLKVFIIDVELIGYQCLSKGIRTILESPRILKVVHDVATFKQCLFLKYSIKFTNYFDTAASDVKLRNMKFHKGNKQKRPLSVLLHDYLYLPPDFINMTKPLPRHEILKNPVEMNEINKAGFTALYLIVLKHKIQKKMLRIINLNNMYMFEKQPAEEPTLPTSDVIENTLNVVTKSFNLTTLDGNVIKKMSDVLAKRFNLTTLDENVVKKISNVVANSFIVTNLDGSVIKRTSNVAEKPFNVSKLDSNVIENASNVVEKPFNVTTLSGNMMERLSNVVTNPFIVTPLDSNVIKNVSNVKECEKISDVVANPFIVTTLPSVATKKTSNAVVKPFNVTTLDHNVTEKMSNVVEKPFNITTSDGNVISLAGNVTMLASNATTLADNATTLAGNVTAFDGNITALDGNKNTLDGNVTTLLKKTSNISSLQGLVKKLSNVTVLDGLIRKPSTTGKKPFTLLKKQANVVKKSSKVVIKPSNVTADWNLTKLDGLVKKPSNVVKQQDKMSDFIELD